MPIYEFRCLDCQQVFEILELNKNEQAEVKCPKCGSDSFERVLSRTHYTIGSKSSATDSSGTTVNSRSCHSGSCTTIDLPGPSR